MTQNKELIEKVARAIGNAFNRSGRKPHDNYWQNFTCEAQAAITAIQSEQAGVNEELLEALRSAAFTCRIEGQEHDAKIIEKFIANAESCKPDHISQSGKMVQKDKQILLTQEQWLAAAKESQELYEFLNQDQLVELANVNKELLAALKAQVEATKQCMNNKYNCEEVISTAKWITEASKQAIANAESYKPDHIGDVNKMVQINSDNSKVNYNLLKLNEQKDEQIADLEGKLGAMAVNHQRSLDKKDEQIRILRGMLEYIKSQFGYWQKSEKSTGEFAACMEAALNTIAKTLAASDKLKEKTK